MMNTTTDVYSDVVTSLREWSIFREMKAAERAAASVQQIVIRRCPGYQVQCRDKWRVWRYWLRGQVIDVLHGKFVKPVAVDPLAPYLYRKGKCNYMIESSPETWRAGRLFQCPQCGCFMIVARSAARRDSLVPVPLRRKDIRQLSAAERESAGYMLFWIFAR